MPKKIVARQLVWLREAAHEAGTVFVVTDDPDPKLKPVQVDPTTAVAWLRQGWAEEEAKPASAAEKK